MAVVSLTLKDYSLCKLSSCIFSQDEKSKSSSSAAQADTAESTPSKSEDPAKDSKAKDKKAGETSKDEVGGESKEKKAEPEPDFQMLSNPARVLPQQVSVCTDGWWCFGSVHWFVACFVSGA